MASVIIFCVTQDRSLQNYKKQNIQHFLLFNFKNLKQKSDKNKENMGLKESTYCNSLFYTKTYQKTFDLIKTEDSVALSSAIISLISNTYPSSPNLKI